MKGCIICVLVTEMNRLVFYDWDVFHMMCVVYSSCHLKGKAREVQNLKLHVKNDHKANDTWL